MSVPSSADYTESERSEPAAPSPGRSRSASRHGGKYARTKPGIPTAAVLVLVLLGGLLGALAGALFASSRPSSYTAHAYVLVAPTAERSGDLSGTELAQAFARVGADPAVVGPAFAAEGLPARPQDIAKAVTAAASPDAPLIDVTGASPSAKQSALLANTAARGLIDHVGRLGATPGSKLVLLTPATVPDQPDSSPILTYTLLGLTIGLGGCGAIASLSRP